MSADVLSFLKSERLHIPSRIENFCVVHFHTTPDTLTLSRDLPLVLLIVHNDDDDEEAEEDDDKLDFETIPICGICSYCRGPCLSLRRRLAASLVIVPTLPEAKRSKISIDRGGSFFANTTTPFGNPRNFPDAAKCE